MVKDKSSENNRAGQGGCERRQNFQNFQGTSVFLFSFFFLFDDYITRTNINRDLTGHLLPSRDWSNLTGYDNMEQRDHYLFTVS